MQAVQQYIKKNQVSRAWVREWVRTHLHLSDRKFKVVKAKKGHVLAFLTEKTVDSSGRCIQVLP